jgi:peptidoglycan hydrolase-like protein with peptidoglycan-binding domain
MSFRAKRHLMSFVAALAVAVAMPAAASAASYGTRTLSIGAHGSDVKKLQRYLVSAGHRVARDGEFGPRTHRALKIT